MPGMARGLSPDWPSWLLLLLRGVHPHRRLHVQPACEMVEGVQRDSVATADRIAQLPAELSRVAPGSQRLQPPGSWVPRPRREQEGGGGSDLPAPGREHIALR